MQQDRTSPAPMSWNQSVARVLFAVSPGHVARHEARRKPVIKYLIGVGGVVVLAANPAFAIGANCGDQLAQIKGQASSELLAKSTIADKYQEAERLCAAGKDTEAQDLAGQIREEMAQKSSAGSSGAPTSAGSPVGGATGQSK